MHIGPGEAFSLLSAAAWAVGVILYRKLVERLPALTLNFSKNALVLLMLLPLPWLLHGSTLPAFDVRDVALSLGSGFLGIAAADTLYFVALARLGAGRMGVIGNAYSPLVIVLSVLFLGERLGPWQVAGFALVMAGVAVIARRREPASVVVGEPVPPPEPAPPPVDPAPRSHLAAVALGVASICLMAVAIVMIKPVLEARPLGWVTLLRLVGALAGLVLIAALRGQLGLLSPRGRRVDWKLLVAAAFVGQCLSMVLWLAGYKYAPAAIAAILNETASIFIVLLAWWWLREPLGRQGVLGVALTISGVVLMLAA
ncbi:MAG: DMT family transporter [Chiayiivirga sp.]|uniref:DMT family transporter n=1 Tax=Denitratimonas tolerans TaxID=1338420 RepID=A0AAW9QZ56_9GAMM|nr:DMT family transporter [Xanthomonadaceae bacterium]MDX9763877.1 DMT family transporter [Chiayiivirga sp.]MEB2316944.1 DMT family transporter [Xanthomonadaceae bacterium]HRO86873.1 DMT family transporter [Chiayiivirga sp.]HRQ35493.1 DMT family transporter [Chiayiivirga sp.]